MNKRGRRLRTSFESEARRLGVKAKLVTGGSHFHWYFCDNEIVDFRSAVNTDAAAYARFTGTLSASGVLTLPNPLSHHAISLAHDEQVLSEMENAFSDALKAVAKAA